MEVDPIKALIFQITGVNDVAEELEALVYAKYNKQFPIFALIKKVWNKVRHLQAVEGFTRYSAIWDNGYFVELDSLTCGARWRKQGVTHLKHIFADSDSRRRCTFIICSCNMLSELNPARLCGRYPQLPYFITWRKCTISKALFLAAIQCYCWYSCLNSL